MPRRLPFQKCLVPLLFVLLIPLSGCTRSASPTAVEKKPDVMPAVLEDSQSVAASPQPAATTGQNRPAADTTLDREVTVVNLPAPIDDACVAAAGRLLVLRLKDLGKLALFDVLSGKIRGYVSLDTPQDAFAAGVDQLMVVGQQNRLVKRYSLANLKPEAERSVPGEFAISAAGMGASSRGPLLVYGESEGGMRVLAIDPPTLQLVEHKVEGYWRDQGHTNGPARVNVSADGSIFCVRGGRFLSFQHFLFGSTDDAHTRYSVKNRLPCYACPDDTGERTYAGNWILSADGKRNPSNDLPLDVQAIPATGGPCYLTVSPGKRRAGSSPTSTVWSVEAGACLQVHLVGESKPVRSLSIDNFPLLTAKANNSWQRSDLYERLFFLPNARVIVELPTSSNTVRLHHLDVDEELRRAMPDDLVIISRSPRRIRVGETLRYQIQTRSKSGKPVFKLDAGPEGMVVSERGLVEWTPSSQQVSSSVGAVVSIEDSGQNKLHTFTLEIQPPADILASADDGPPPGSWANDKPIGNLRLKLPAAYDDVCVGGNGRFLVFTFPSLQKAAVFDVSAAKIIGYVPVVGKSLIAAGMDKFVVVSPQHSTIERFDLQSLRRECQQTLSLRGQATCIGMGAASDGPVLVVAAQDERFSQIQLLDLETLTRAEYKKQNNLPVTMSFAAGSRAYVSADGHVFSIVGTSGACLLDLKGQELTARHAQQVSSRFPDWIVPDETGDRIYSLNGIAGDRFRDTAGRRQDNHPRPPESCFIPAIHGPLYLRLTPRRPGYSASICLSNVDKPLASLRDLPFPTVSIATENRTGRPMFEKHTLDRRVYLIPNAKVIAMLPEGQELVVLCRFDLDEELKRSGADYLAIVSRPPRNSPPGTKFEYQLDVRSKAGKASYRLDSGPKGMHVSETGLVRWEVKNPPEAPAAKVQITVTDASGKSLQHSFELTACDEPKLAAASSATRPTVHGSMPPPVAGKASGEWQLTQVDDRWLRIPQGNIVLRPGLHYQSMLLLQGNHLAVLSADGMKVLRTHNLGEKYSRIAERQEYYVAVALEPPVIDLLDKKTLATIRRIRRDHGRPIDLAIHPTRPISYVGILPDRMGTNGSFVMVDEIKGEVRGSLEYLGQWIAVDASGRRLVAAGPYQGIGKPNLLIVPRLDPSGQLVTLPPSFGGSLPVAGAGENGGWLQLVGLRGRWAKDVLVVYDLADDGEPQRSAGVSLSGLRVGLRMASDGRRATCIGDSANSASLISNAVNLDALGEKPIEYAMGGKPIKDLAFHPVLALVACLGSVGPVLFERETGQPQPKALTCPAADLEDATFYRLWFSADGKGLLLDMVVPESGRFLYRAELSLSASELARVRRRLANMTSLGQDRVTDHGPKLGKKKRPSP